MHTLPHATPGLCARAHHLVNAAPQRGFGGWRSQQHENQKDEDEQRIGDDLHFRVAGSSDASVPHERGLLTWTTVMKTGMAAAATAADAVAGKLSYSSDMSMPVTPDSHIISSFQRCSARL